MIIKLTMLFLLTMLLLTMLLLTMLLLTLQLRIEEESGESVRGLALEIYKFDSEVIPPPKG